MNDAIIVAIISAGATIIGQWLISKKQHEEDSKALAVELKGITDRLDVHNGYAEKIGGLADDMSAVKEDMSAIKTDISWLKEEVRK